MTQTQANVVCLPRRGLTTCYAVITKEEEECCLFDLRGSGGCIKTRYKLVANIYTPKCIHFSYVANKINNVN